MKTTKFFAAVGLTLALAPNFARAAAPPNANRFTSAGIRTLQMSSEIVTENRDALNKISGDIALAYRIHQGAMFYEQPGKLRIEASIPHLISGAYVINGNRKLTVAPFIHKVQDVTGAPGKKQTLLDFGFLPPEQLAEYNATFLHKDHGLLVYQVMPKIKTEPLKDVIWLDPRTKITVKRLNYDRDGHLTKWFLYKNPVQISPGIYVPTRVEMYNPQNQLAGATVYKNIRVNQAVNESLFRI